MIIRVEKNRDFSIVSNAILRDKRMTMKARFLLVFCLSMSDSWEFSAQGLATGIGASVDAIKSGLRELEEFGYLVRRQTRINGKLSTMEYILREEPLVEKPPTVLPSTVLPSAEKPMQTNTNITNTKETNTNISSIAKTPPKRTQKAFVPPTLDEVIAYAKERNSKVDPKYFYDYYSSADWKDGRGQEVKSWKQRFVTWDNKERKRREQQVEDTARAISQMAEQLPDPFEFFDEKSFMDKLLEEEKNG